jgi:hypothetical protein
MERADAATERAGRGSGSGVERQSEQKERAVADRQVRRHRLPGSERTCHCGWVNRQGEHAEGTARIAKR